MKKIFAIIIALSCAFSFAQGNVPNQQNAFKGQVFSYGPNSGFKIDGCAAGTVPDASGAGCFTPAGSAPSAPAFSIQLANTGLGSFTSDPNVLVNTSTHVLTSALNDKGGQVFNVLAYGAKCDGVTDDTTAINTVLADAVVAASTGTTTTVLFPAGTCLGDFYILQANGVVLKGAGETATILLGKGVGPALQTNGFWYSRIQDMSFEVQDGPTANAVLDIDGNYDGTHTMGVQFDTFLDIHVRASGTVDGVKGLYAVAVGRQGLGYEQGSNLTFINTLMGGTSATGTAYYQYGYNALSNQFIGGDFQDFQLDAINVVFGGLQVIGTTFETTNGCAQIINGGYDIHASSGGAFASISAIGDRSEGWTFYYGGGGQQHYISGFTQASSFNSWHASTSTPLNNIVSETGTDGNKHAYCVTTAGITAATQPTWPTSGTVTDGTVVWTEENYNVVEVTGTYGKFDYASSYVDPTATVRVQTATQGWGSPFRTDTNRGGVGIIGDSSYTELALFGTTGLDISTNSGAAIASRFKGLNASFKIPANTGILSIGANLSIGAFIPSLQFVSNSVTSSTMKVMAGSSQGTYDICDITDSTGTVKNICADKSYNWIQKTGVIESAQTVPTITGCGTISGQVGGAIAGTFVTSATNCTPVLTALPTTATGYACMLWDQTHSTAPIGNVSSTTTSATFGTLTTTASDVIAFNCGISY